MQFSSAIEKIMPDVRNGSDEPFVIYRDGSGDWHCDFTQNQYGEPYDWVEDIKKIDPLAVTFKCSDFANGSQPYVYDKALAARFRAEYENTFINADMGELRALVNFLEDNLGELSSEATDYITGFYAPLAELHKIVNASLYMNDFDAFHKEDNVLQFVEIIEDRADTSAKRNAINKAAAEPAPAKRVIDGCEEKHSLRLAGRDIIFAENPNAEEPYLVCFAKNDNPLGLTEYYDIQYAADYVEAMWIFNNYQAALLQELKAERGAYHAPAQTLTAADCIPGSLNEDLKDKIIVIKPEALAPEYRRSERQLKICTGGFGVAPNSRGNAVFCQDLFSGKESRYERYDVAGAADPAKLPEWAVKKIALMEAIKEPGVFEYGGYHFKPVRQFRKGEIDKRLENDSRPWKNDAQFAMRNMGTLIKPPEGYSHEEFYAKSGDSKADIFKCIETGYLFVPCANGLRIYDEPPKKTKATDKKPSLLGKLDDNKQKVERDKAANKDKPATKKRGDTEVTD